MARHRVAHWLLGKGAVPIGIGASQRGGGGLVRAKAQQHERRRSPLCPILGMGSGMDKFPQPAHRAARLGIRIIAGTRNNCNRHQRCDPSPVSPAVKLREIVSPHQPDKTPIGITSYQRLKRINSETRAKLPFNRGRPDWHPPRHFLRRPQPDRERRHIGCPRLERIARRNQPP